MINYLKKNLKTKRGQSAVEYLVLFIAIAIMLISTDFIGRVKTGFENHFQAVKAIILN